MPRVQPSRFFRRQSEHSRVKAEIVAEYALAWFQVFLGPKNNPTGKGEAAYIDLFSGPGHYEDKHPSTPPLIVGATLKQPRLTAGVRLYFNDQNEQIVERLRQTISQYPGVESLNYTPVYTSAEASPELINSYGISEGVPQLFFLDQFGWSDVSPELLKRVFVAKRCDCLLFVRTSRLLAAVRNPQAKSPLEALLGHTRVQELHSQFMSKGVDREHLILEAIRNVSREAGATVFQAFPFRVRHHASPTHHLIYLGKHWRGLNIVRDIMSRKSSLEQSGVPVIGYSRGPVNLSLFEEDPIEELAEDLRSVFRNSRQKVEEIVMRHQMMNSRFSLQHYQEALRRLEERDHISITPEASKRPWRKGKVTMAESLIVEFDGSKELK